MDKSRKEQTPLAPGRTIRGAWFLTFTVCGVCLATVIFCAHYTYKHWPRGRRAGPPRNPVTMQRPEVYPDGWDFLNPRSKNWVNFGKQSEEEAEKSSRGLLADAQPPADASSAPPSYVTAKFTPEITNTPPETPITRRSPMYTIQEHTHRATAPDSPPVPVLMQATEVPDDPLSPRVGGMAGVAEFNSAVMAEGEAGPHADAAPYVNDGLKLLRLFNLHAQNRLAKITEEIHDYHCILYKWDQTNVVRGQRDVMYMLLREEPFSVYARYLAPEHCHNREFIYWEGHYENALVVSTGDSFSNRTLLLSRDSAAIRNNATYDVVDMGFRKLLARLVDISDDTHTLKEAKVRYYDNARVGNRACYALEVTFPRPLPDLEFSCMEVMVDRELDLPIRVAMYGWSDTPGVAGALLEEYIYVIKGINIGLKDVDFCYLNSHYNFREFVPRLSQREKDFMKTVLKEYQRQR